MWTSFSYVMCTMGFMICTKVVYQLWGISFRLHMTVVPEPLFSWHFLPASYFCAGNFYVRVQHVFMFSICLCLTVCPKPQLCLHNVTVW
jgi:hypothetical protein